MGVHGLWELLAPVGRRVSVETLTGKRLAIDASIWMIQFMKAMRDDKGEMVRNAHILGFFRRICKLLFLRTKPVFVFDGGTPALKRRTVVARRRQRENAQAKIRKTAEKLLLNHLKAMRLKELAKDLENQRRGNDVKGKKVMTDQLDVAENNLEGNDTISGSYNQEAVDEMLAASLAAEEDGSYDGNASTSGAGMPIEEEDGDDDEEMILPMVHGKVDPAVLAALPPSMQLDLLVQMRERLIAENRQKYQKVKQAPAKFSELQIQAYLKTVAFRREIDEVQRSAAGKGVGGVQTSRIASESNREFIFSSSFTGDKQMLTSAGVERNSDEQCMTQTGHPSESSDKFPSTNKSSAPTGSVVDEPTGLFDDGVERYLDERGRLRVSRVRAMGIRMTRDLQRNLDLMKEIEQERTNANDTINNESVLGNNGAGITRRFSNKIQFPEASYRDNDGTNANELSMSEAGTSMEISFEDEGERKCVDGEDDLFARLVTGGPVMISSADGTSSMKLSDDSASDCDWEEGIIGEKDSSLTDDVEVKYKLSLEQDGNNDDDEIEWEEGDSDVLKCSSQGPAELRATVSKGVLEEEADFQEAIRRSLNDLMSQKFIDASSEDERYKGATEMTSDSTSNGPLHQENARVEANMQLPNDVLQSNESSCEILDGVGVPDLVGGANILKTNDSSEMQLASSLAVNPGNVEVMTDRPCERYVNSHPEIIRQDASESENLHRKIGDKEPITPIKEKRVQFAVEPLSDTSNDVGHIFTDANGYSGVGSHISDSPLVDVPNIVVSDARQNDFEAAYSEEITDQGDSTTKASRVDIDAMQKLEEKNYGSLYEEKDDDLDMSAVKHNREQVEVTQALLEEEMLILGKERADLGEEQRKLERNMESVSSEMFAECQELLQMFGLPYIIAPMEAEAQCAYMELANLVDGVVTDDSDAFLFGAQSVYKNIFDDRKYVETYFLKDIENELGLTREKLIRMALLLGSDYTEGVSGIGIVNAIEVVNAFPEEDGLQKFREWIESPDPTILGKFNVQTGSSLKNRSSKVGNNDTSCSVNSVEGDSTADHNNASEFMDSLQKTKQIFMDKHRNVSKNWHIPSSFPSEAVVSAYASPKVDKSTEPFSWGKPDHFVLRKLCWEKFGWASQKADELLIPVLKEYGKHETQLRLEAFYTFNERFAKIRSKRIKKAIKGIAGNKSLVLMDDSRQGTSESRKKRKLSPIDSGNDKSGKPLGRTDDSFAGDEKNSTEKSIAKKSRKKRNGDAESSVAGNAGPQMGKERSQKTNKGSSARGGGRGRELAFRRGRRKENSGLEYAETSSNDENNEKEVQVEKLVASHGTRRSTRLRKAVKYAVDDLEIDEPGKSDQDNEKSTDEKAVDEEPLSNHDLVGDAAASPSRKNQHKDGDPSVEGLSPYLETGGGFCMGEVEAEEGGHIYSGQDVDDPSFAALSKDYLKMGGGFCLDEDEVEKEPDILTTIAENADTSHYSGCMEEVDNDDTGEVQLVSSPPRALDGLPKDNDLGHSNITPNDNHFKADMSPPQCNKEVDSEASSVRFLSAMPNLRRKRRKN